MKLAHYIDFIRPGGGPMGYLYNLDLALSKSKDNKYIDVVSEKKSDSREVVLNTREEYFKKIKRYFPKFIAVIIHYLYYYLKLKTPLNKQTLYKLNEYDIVVVHNFILFSKYRKYKKKEVDLYCMNHSPVSYSEELCDYISNFHKSVFMRSFFLNFFSKLELNEYCRSGNVVVPCREAVDGYFYYNKTIANVFNKLNFIEVPTGMNGLKPLKDYKEVRKELEIKDNQKAVCFVGRFNEHKGFDLYNQISSLLNSNSLNKDVVCFSVGSGKIKPGNDVINLGWRTDIGDVINGMDLIINCNEHTYFDLLIIEAMSLGKAIMATNVGGNKFVAKSTQGVILFERDSLIGISDKIISLSKDDLKDLGRKNLLAYNMYYNSENFLANHLILAEELTLYKKNRKIRI